MWKWLGGLASGLVLAWMLQLVPTAQAAVDAGRRVFATLAPQAAAGRDAVWILSGVVAVLSLALATTWWMRVGREAYGDLTVWIVAAQVALSALLVGVGVHLVADANPLGLLPVLVVATLLIRKAGRLYRLFAHPVA